MEALPWLPGGEDGVPEEWREGEEPPEIPEDYEEPEVPDPNMEGMPTIFGYEDCDFDKKKKERPPKEHHHEVSAPVPQEIKSVAVPNEEECRQAMVAWVESNGCFGKDPINTMNIDGVEPSNAFNFTVETYVEKRKAGYEYKPYKGGEVDDPSQGRAPEAWEIKVKVDKLFKKQDEKIEVPHTSSVRTCHYCIGRGFVRCERCKGWGRHLCTQCKGFFSMCAEGAPEEEGHHMCETCNDGKYENCGTCGADGRITCPACDGYRAIRCFIQLKVKFKNYKEEYVKEGTDLPDQLIEEVKGVTIFEQEHEKLAPIEGFPIPEIDMKSQQFLSKHRKELLDKKRLIQQRMKLVAVPVAEVNVTWKGDQRARFWVYGKERKVYCPDYPDQCACCIIL